MQSCGKLPIVGLYCQFKERGQHIMKFVGNKIAIGDVTVEQLAAQYGTPLYVYDEQ